MAAPQDDEQYCPLMQVLPAVQSALQYGLQTKLRPICVQPSPRAQSVSTMQVAPVLATPGGAQYVLPA